MKVLITLGAYSLFVHYRALIADGTTRISWDLMGGLQEKLSAHIERIISAHYQTPDEFAAWFKTQELTVLNGGFVAFEDAVNLARAAYEAAHEAQ